MHTSIFRRILPGAQFWISIGAMATSFLAVMLCARFVAPSRLVTGGIIFIIVISAKFGGFTPGLLATLGTCLGMHYSPAQPYYLFGSLVLSSFGQEIILLSTGIVFTVAFELNYRWQRSLGRDPVRLCEVLQWPSRIAPTCVEISEYAVWPTGAAATDAPHQRNQPTITETSISEAIMSANASLPTCYFFSVSSYHGNNEPPVVVIGRYFVQDGMVRYQSANGIASVPEIAIKSFWDEIRRHAPELKDKSKEALEFYANRHCNGSYSFTSRGVSYRPDLERFFPGQRYPAVGQNSS